MGVYNPRWRKERDAKMARIVISTANDENDDWLKKIDNGKWQRLDLEAHIDAAKLANKSKVNKTLLEVFDDDEDRDTDIPVF